MTPANAEAVSVAAMVVAVIGVYLNNHRRRACFALFLLSNAASFAVHVHAGIVGMCVRDAIFFFLAVHGFCLWRNNHEKE